MLRGYKEFLTKSNAFALAVGVIIGAATQKLVSAIVDDLIMPAVAVILPPGDWREAQIVLTHSLDANGKMTVTALKYGHFLGSIIDFVIISFVVFLITKMLLEKGQAEEKAETRTCPECLEIVPLAAKKCRACTSSLN